jgi:hypothetical protein
VLGRRLEPLVVLIHMYKNRHVIILILVSRFGGCREGHEGLWRISWVCTTINNKRRKASLGIGLSYKLVFNFLSS